MRKFIQGPIETSHDDLMKKLGYSLHCSKENLPCYHRKLGPEPFPRFHAYVQESNSGFFIDVHFDQENLHGQSNHDKEWSYSGGRVDEEIRRITSVLNNGNKQRIVGSDSLKVKPKKISRKSLFEILIK